MARDPYEVVLADLRAKRDDIDRLIVSLEAFRPLSGPSRQLPQPASLDTSSSLFEPGPYTGMSIVDAAKAALKENGGQMSTADLANAIQVGGLSMKSTEPVNTVSSILHRARMAGGEIVRVGRGVWALAEPTNPQTVEEQAAQGLLASREAEINLTSKGASGDPDDDIPF